MASTSLFGSIPVAKPKPIKANFGIPQKSVKVGDVHYAHEPSFHAPHFAHVPASMLKVKGPSASAMDFHNTSLKDLTPASGSGSGGGGGGFLGSLGSDVVGFVGHLGTDAIDMAKGFPTGVAYMFHHPIAAAEKSGSATWADWSPLFHGDVRTWAHNFYEHPLAPILDVASVLTLGAGTAARTADVLGAVGKAAEAAQVAGAAGADTAGVDAAVKAAGTMARLGKLARPADVAAAANLGRAEAAGLTATERAAAIEQGAQAGLNQTESIARAIRLKASALNEMDPAINRTVGDTAKMAQQWSRTPLIRARQMLTRDMGNWAAESKIGQAFKMDKIVGDAATASRWRFMDGAARAASMSHSIQRMLAALHKGGEFAKNFAPDALIKMVGDSMHQSLKDSGRAVDAATAPVGKAIHDQGLVYVKATEHLGTKETTNVVGKSAGRAFDGARKVTYPGLLQKVAEKAASKGHDAAIEHGLTGLHDTLTTSDPALAAKDALGNPLAVPSDLAHRLGTEAMNAHRTIRLLYDNPTRVWRHMMLGLSPRYFVNNFVGNTLMLMAATDPVSLTKAFFNHLKVVRGAEAAQREWEASIRAAVQRMPKAVQAYHMANAEEKIAARRVSNLAQGGNRSMFGRTREGANPYNVISGAHQTFSRSNVDIGKAEEATGRSLTLSKALNRTGKGYEITHNLADMPQRYMAMNYTLMRMPEYHAALKAYRAAGLSHDAAAYRAAEEALSSNAVRHTVDMQVTHMLGQYHTFRKWEKTTRRVVPFYAWDRAIVGHMRDLMATQPYKVAMIGAIGHMGAGVRQSMLGNLPSFMQGVVPGGLIPGMGNDPGRMGILNTSSMNPYGTIADLTQLGMTAAGVGQGGPKIGDSLGSQLNPLLVNTIGMLGGTDPVTGAPYQSPGGPPMLQPWTALAQSPSQVQLLQQLFGGPEAQTTKSGKPTLYEKGAQFTLGSLLGFPEKQFSQSSADNLYQQELPKGQRQRKHSVPSYTPAF
jgi:hypothetical protein